MLLRFIFALFVGLLAAAFIAMVLFITLPLSVAIIHYFPVVGEGTLILFIGKIVLWTLLLIGGGIGGVVFISFVLFNHVPSLRGLEYGDGDGKSG